MQTAPLRYRTFDSFAALAHDSTSLESLIALYRTTFGDPSVWGETYTRHEVLCKLRAELAGAASLRLCLHEHGETVAFCWAQALDAEGIAHAMGTIKSCQHPEMPDVRPLLRPVIGDARVIYVHDLGIAAAYRGKVALTELIYPVLCEIAARAGVNAVLFWSVADTLVSRFARRAAFEQCLSVQGMEFHLGRFERMPRPVSAHGLHWLPGASVQGVAHAPWS